MKGLFSSSGCQGYNDQGPDNWRQKCRLRENNYGISSIDLDGFTNPPRMKKTMKRRPRVVLAQTSP